MNAISVGIEEFYAEQEEKEELEGLYFEHKEAQDRLWFEEVIEGQADMDSVGWNIYLGQTIRLAREYDQMTGNVLGLKGKELSRIKMESMQP